MKTEIWCRQTGGKRAVLARTLNFIIPDCKYITVWDGWASEDVLSRTFDCDSQTLIITISPDNGEYSEKAKNQS